MGQPIHLPVRQQILQLKTEGKSNSAIAETTGLSFWTVRKLVRRQRKGGHSGLAPDYSRCGRRGVFRSDALLRRAACWLKRLHPDWGAPFIRMKLGQRYADAAIPSARQMQRWFRNTGLNAPRPKKEEEKKEDKKPERASSVHETWQVDAKERLRLANGQAFCYLSFIDERSGGALEALVFPYYRISQVPPKEVFDKLMPIFQQWGCPQKLRVDNGEPFGSPQTSTTSELAFCLLAFGIRVKTNRPAVPQDNSKVERLQGTSKRWSEVLQAQTLDEAQLKLDQAILIQREQYPVCRFRGKTRLQMFPELNEKIKIWTPDEFEPQRVYDFLATKQYVRKVSAAGQVTHFGHKHTVGAQSKNQSVCLKLNPFMIQWEIYAANGQFIKSLEAQYLAPSRIKNMTVYSKN